MTILGFVLAAMVGLSLGLMGGGGSILTVPIFVYVLGFAAKPAIAMSLPVVGATSLVGALGHWRAGNVHLRTALLFGVIAMAGSYLGARLAVFISGAVQLTTLAIVMLAAALTGYGLTLMKTWERLLLFVASVLVITPSRTMTLIGLALAAPIVVRQYLNRDAALATPAGA